MESPLLCCNVLLLQQSLPPLFLVLAMFGLFLDKQSNMIIEYKHSLNTYTHAHQLSHTNDGCHRSGHFWERIVLNAFTQTDWRENFWMNHVYLCMQLRSVIQ